MRSPQQRLGLTQTQRLALNASLQASIAVLRTDAAGLTRFLEEQVADNPHLRLDPTPAPGLMDWLPRWTDVLAKRGMGNAIDISAESAPSLIAHVMQACEGLRLSNSDHRIAVALIEGLEPSGWLGPPVADIARDAGVGLAQVQAVLDKLQTIDPPGIFARNLAECLRLQAAEQGALDEVMALILDNLDLLANGELSRLAKMCKTTEPQILARFGVIRAMNPKPGAQFAAVNASHVREPDLVAHQDGERWTIALNRSALPVLTIAKSDQGTAAGWTAAKAVERMVAARNSTLLLVGREILQRQQEALRQGPVALAPMTMADLAEALGFHESTISRVVAGASLDTPRGTWWLRQMFSPAMGGDGQPVVSAAALRHHLARLIAAEDKAKPLSDAALTVALADTTGVTIARRTVAKYREDQGIPAAHGRKRAVSLPRLGKKGRAKG